MPQKTVNISRLTQILDRNKEKYTVSKNMHKANQRFLIDTINLQNSMLERLTFTCTNLFTSVRIYLINKLVFVERITPYAVKRF